MNPIKEKLSDRNYLSQRLRKLVGGYVKQHSIRSTEWPRAMQPLAQFMSNNRIYEKELWGYGIERASNGHRTIENSESPKQGYLITFFYLNGASIYVFNKMLRFDSGHLTGFLPQTTFPTKRINRVEFDREKKLLYIGADVLDEDISLNVDVVAHGEYYLEVLSGVSGAEVPNLLSQSIPSEKPIEKIDQEKVNSSINETWGQMMYRKAEEYSNVSPIGIFINGTIALILTIMIFLGC